MFDIVGTVQSDFYVNIVSILPANSSEKVSSSIPSLQPSCFLLYIILFLSSSSLNLSIRAVCTTTDEHTENWDVTDPMALANH